MTTSALVPVSTYTTLAGLNDGSDGNHSSNSGLTGNQKRTVIGIVVGVGGVILLAGLALVGRRVWANRRAAVPDDDDLVGSLPVTSGPEKGAAIGGGSSPFKSTLDQYHTPAQPINTASNF